MYDRAERFLLNANKNTSSDVGPGSYDVEEFKSNACEGYAPFSSLNPRESFLAIKDDENAFPGPGSYEPEMIYDHIKGASSLGNASKRFDTKYNETPGPGKYEILRSINKKDNGENNDYIRRRTVPRQYAPASIPSPGQAFGYEEGRDGVLRKHKAPTIDKTLGPAFYFVNHEDSYPVQQYKGVHFGSMTAKRDTIVSGQDIPGPGTYTVHQKSNNLNTIILEEQKKRTVDANLPRYYEIVPITEAKKAYLDLVDMKSKVNLNQWNLSVMST